MWVHYIKILKNKNNANKIIGDMDYDGDKEELVFLLELLQKCCVLFNEINSTIFECDYKKLHLIRTDDYNYDPDYDGESWVKKQLNSII